MSLFPKKVEYPFKDIFISNIKIASIVFVIWLKCTVECSDKHLN